MHSKGLICSLRVFMQSKGLNKRVDGYLPVKIGIVIETTQSAEIWSHSL